MSKGFAVLLLVLASATPALAGTVQYDAVTDFSVAANPNGPWSYLVNGSLLTVGGTCGFVGTECWWNGGSLPYSSAMGKNITNHPIQVNGTTVLPPGELTMDPQSNSLMLTWTAPYAGNWFISGYFSGLDAVSASHPAEVILDSSTTLFSTTIDANGEVSLFSLNLALNAGDVLDFEVDHGAGYSFLSTGFNAIISTTTPEPSSWSLLALALAGLAVWRGCARSRSRRLLTLVR
jgi:PEP-CTERM motif